ncbi:hypothetical protein [Vibrio parahaemolyticus]|uniref:hypothetical protein n=1 Tax=Vibrio parahaemolyticus TaxID=670 RepID=UPI001121462C|nr:hypothetical protein [Vibrio parahaemolyticus]TNY79159.1 hypothetical protein CGK62_05255 [Vibrio parahaemolyticus]
MKYQTEMDSIQNCPPNAKEQIDQEAYRLVREPLNSDSFLPPGIMKPSRAEAETREERKCSFYALSLFTTERNAEKHYNKLKGKYKNIENTIGSNIAVGRVEQHDGYATKPTRSGHFDFFENTSCDLAKKFNIIKSL